MATTSRSSFPFGAAKADAPSWLEHAVFGIVFLLAVWLFQHQIADPAAYLSDTPTHIEFAVAGRGYSLMAVFLCDLVLAFGGWSSWAVAVFEALLAVGVYYPMAGLCRKILKSGRAAAAVSGILLFWSSIYIPAMDERFYAGSFVTQPWHNITYFGMRLFATWTTCRLFDILPRFGVRFSAMDWVRLALPLALATAIKPNFFLAFSVSLLLFLACHVCAGRFARRFWEDALKLGTVVFPSAAILFLQSCILYAGGTGGASAQSGIAFLFPSSPWFAAGAWPFLLVLSRSLALALLVLAFHCRKGAGLSAGEKFLYLQETAGLFFFLFFVETGPREFHGNFGWTAYVTAYLLYGAVLARFAEDWTEWRLGGKGRIAYLVAGTLLLAGHAASGMAYFARLLAGIPYGD